MMVSRWTAFLEKDPRSISLWKLHHRIILFLEKIWNKGWKIIRSITRVKMIHPRITNQFAQIELGEKGEKLNDHAVNTWK